MSTNSNHSNHRFNEIIDNCKAWVKKNVVGVCGYGQSVIHERLLQRIAEVGHYPFALAFIKARGVSNETEDKLNGCIDIGLAIVDSESGEIEVAPRRWIANQFKFILHWTYCLGSIFNIANRRTDSGPATLVSGLDINTIFAKGNDENFVEFCNSSAIAPLHLKRRLIIQSANEKTSSNSSFIYARRPLIFLLKTVNLGFLGRLTLLFNHLRLLVSYVIQSLRAPSLTLIATDFAYSQIAFSLSKRGFIESIVLTCSEYTAQPLWTRGLDSVKVHMLWYAQNWRPIAYVADGLVEPLPQLPWIRVDKHWVWTSAFADYLRELGHTGEVQKVPPILWYLPKIGIPSGSSINITVFDTPAISDEMMLRHAGETSNYYKSANLQKFIGDICSLKPDVNKRFEKPVVLQVKTKRDWTPVYDREYYDWLAKLGMDGVLELVSPLANIFSLVSSSHLVIVYPFSTVAYIAEWLNIPVVYYDPTGSILRRDFSDAPFEPVLAGSREELVAAVLSALESAVLDANVPG